jgi:hypothetical protein
MLSVRERDVVKMRFGIGYESAYTLDEIGKKFHLTRERIRQIEGRRSPVLDEIVTLVDEQLEKNRAAQKQAAAVAH